MNIHIYRQADRRWSSLPYPTYSSSFGGNGCGACAILHCIIEMNKYKNWTPANVQPYMKQFAVNYQGTLWSGIPTAMKHYGLQDVKNIPTMNQLWKELGKGNRVGVLLFGSRRGPDGTVWTGGGHYIAFVDYKVEKGQHWLYLKDSGGRYHDRWWSYEKSMRGDVLQVWTGVLPQGHESLDTYKNSLKKTGYTGEIPNDTVGRKYGSSTDVKNWQKFLNWWYDFKLSIDGDFGNGTEFATIEFQDANGLSADGIAGPKTLAKAKTYLTKKDSKSTPAPTQKTTAKFTKEKVIDISYVQSQPIDWKKVKADGIAGAIIRCGYRGYSSAKLVEDSMFMKHVAGAQSVGLKIGVYFFTEAINAKEGKEEAQFTLKMIKKAGINPTYPIAIDTESINGSPTPRANTSKLSTAKRTEAIKAFCEEIKANGYEPMIYASTSWLNNQLDMSKLLYTVWVAQYNDKVTYKGNYTLWQYTSLGKVSGINQVVDLSWCYKEYKPKTKTTTKKTTSSTKPYQNLQAKDFVSTKVYIGQATSGEQGKAKGGKAGDQSGNEVAISKWSYSANNQYNTWKYMFRAVDSSARLKIAQAVIDSCNNNHIGYDQQYPDRKSCFKAAKKVKFDMSKITTDCEVTCSELANVCIAAAGLKSYLPVDEMAYVNSLRDKLLKSDEFKTYKGSSYVSKSDKLKPGDILISGTHVAIVVKAPK